MRKPKLLQSIFAFILTINITTMNAQHNTGTNGTLTPQQQSIVVISALTATGDLKHLEMQLNAGLDAGLSISEIKEILVQMYAYCGFPRSLNAISTFMKVTGERKAKGIADVQGREALVSPGNPDKYELGRKTLEILTKTAQAKPAPGFGAFAPRIDAFLKEHLFADIFESDVLSYQQRELATISALAAMPGVEAQLQSHLAMGKNTGITDSQLLEAAELVEQYISRTQANTIRKLLAQPVVPILETSMIVRISEIEIVPEYLEEYKAIAKEIAAASVKMEPGVLAIFPMYQKENPAQIRIIEIYADKNAYQSHLQTTHFKQYKAGSLKMVKSLKLVDMEPLDKETMLEIFRKIK